MSSEGDFLGFVRFVMDNYVPVPDWICWQVGFGVRSVYVAVLLYGDAADGRKVEFRLVLDCKEFEEVRSAGVATDMILRRVAKAVAEMERIKEGVS